MRVAAQSPEARRRCTLVPLPCRHAATMSNGGRWAESRAASWSARLPAPAFLPLASRRRKRRHGPAEMTRAAHLAARPARSLSPASRSQATRAFRRAAPASYRYRVRVCRLASPVSSEAGGPPGKEFPPTPCFASLTDRKRYLKIATRSQPPARKPALPSDPGRVCHGRVL